MEFRDKVVLITGGGGGIGKAAARRFLEEGARGVVLGSRRQEVLDAAKEELDPSGERIELFAGDASEQETAKAFVAAATERFGGVDVLVNSTGIFRVKPFEEETEDDFEEAMNSILRPTFYTSQAAVPEMKKRGGGAIVSVGSMWAIDAIATTPTSAYSAAQAGRHALTWRARRQVGSRAPRSPWMAGSWRDAVRLQHSAIVGRLPGAWANKAVPQMGGACCAPPPGYYRQGSLKFAAGHSPEHPKTSWRT